MKNVDFAVEGMLAGEDADLFTTSANERETVFELALGGRRFILSLRKTRKDGPHDTNADRHGL